MYRNLVLPVILYLYAPVRYRLSYLCVIKFGLKQ